MAQKSKASWQLRQALKHRRRRWRRRRVVWFYIGMLLSIIMSAGGTNDRRDVEISLCLILIAWQAGGRWFLAQQRIAASLDDLAQAAHGVNFDQLSGDEKEAIERRFRKHGWRRIYLDIEWVQDERQQQAQLRAKGLAFEFLRTALPWFLAVCWAGYLWLPVDLRSALLDGPLITSWLAVFVVTLPPAIEMWTRPDEINEPRVV